MICPDNLINFIGRGESSPPEFGSYLWVRIEEIIKDGGGALGRRLRVGE